MTVLFRHDGACPRRALTDRLIKAAAPPHPRFRVASAAFGGGRDAETEKSEGRSGVVLACQSALHRDEPGGGEAE